MNEHLGDPCVYCGTPHDSVEVGDCPGNSRTAYQCWTCGQTVPQDQPHECPGKAGPRPGTGWLDGIGTVRPCLDCGVLVAGGPTRCIRCVRDIESRERQTPAATDPVRITYAPTETDILVALNEEADYLRNGPSGATTDELADLLGLAAEEIQNLRDQLTRLRKVYAGETDEFNAGYMAYESAIPFDAEPSSTPHDQWRVGWAWAQFNARNPGRIP
jgi:hypothetical protein